MTDSTAPIHALIKEAKTNLSRLEDKASVLRTQIESYERVLRAIEAANGSVRQNKSQQLIGLAENALGPRRRRGSITMHWAKILSYVGQFPEGIKSEKIHEQLESQGMGVDRNNLRSQLHNHSISGVLERVSPGVFRLTSHGRDLVNSTLENDMLEKTVA